MKRRIFSLLCMVCLCLALFLPVQAIGEVCFTAINDTVLPLTADSMPVWSGGVLYVPHTVFDASTTGISLSTSTSYNKTSGMVSIFNMNQMLVFDIGNGTCYDQHTGQSYSGRAIVRNGKAYVPAARVCSFFGLSAPTYQLTDYGYLVRIKNSDAALSDKVFIDAASNVMTNRLRDYNQSLQPQEPVTPSVPAAPTTPTVTPEPEPTAITTYLAFRCDTLQSGAEIAETLEKNGRFGLFFFPAQSLEGQGALIRRLLGCGHSVGILAEGESAEQTMALLETGSRALDSVAHSRTYFALVPKDHRQRAANDGWVCWNSSVDAIPTGKRSAYSFAQSTVRSLPSRGRVYLTLDDSQYTASALPTLLRQLSDKNYAISIPRESRL